MIRSLDGCICELEAGMLREPRAHHTYTYTLWAMCFRECSFAAAARAEDEMPVFFLELAQVVEKGSEDSPSLKSLQQGIQTFHWRCLYLWFHLSSSDLLIVFLTRNEQSH